MLQKYEGKMKRDRMAELEEQGFCAIKKEDVSCLKRYYEDMEKEYASSVALLSIYAWKDNLPAYYREMEEYLWFVVYDKINARWVSLPLIGNYQADRINAALAKLELVMKELEIPLIFTDMTPWMVPFYREYFGERMEVIEEKELEEYIYPKDQFYLNLSRQRERYNYKYFTTRQKIEVKELNREQEKECLQILEESFCSLHSCEECEYGCQKDTLLRALSAMEERDAGGFIIYADEKPVAYNMISKENRQLVFHFKKNNRGLRGMNEFIHKETVERFGEQLSEINYTEDMGVEGLKKYKSNLCTFTLQPKLEIRIQE